MADSSNNNRRRKDITVLVLSLLLAFSVWMIHNLSALYSQVISVPITAECNIKGYHSTSVNSVEVSARCRATGYRLLSARREERRNPVTVLFDAEDMDDRGEGVFVVSSNMTKYVKDIFGDAIQFESFLVPSLEFRFTPENCKSVPVQLVHDLSFKPQYMLTEPVSISPDSVLVYGDPQYIDKIDRVYTKSLVLDGISRDKHGVVKLDVPTGLRLSVDEVGYSMDVARFVEIRTMVNMSVRNQPSGKSLFVYPSTAEVVLYCNFPLGSDPSDEVSFWIDYNEFIASRNGRCVARSGKLPSNVIDYKITPQVFECVEEVR